MGLLNVSAHCIFLCLFLLYLTNDPNKNDPYNKNPAKIVVTGGVILPGSFAKTSPTTYVWRVGPVQSNGQSTATRTISVVVPASSVRDTAGSENRYASNTLTFHIDREDPTLVSLTQWGDEESNGHQRLLTYRCVWSEGVVGFTREDLMVTGEFFGL